MTETLFAPPPKPVAWASESKNWSGERLRNGIAANNWGGAGSDRPTALVSP